MSEFLPDWAPPISSQISISISHSADGYQTFEPPKIILVANCTFEGQMGLKIVGVSALSDEPLEESTFYFKSISDFSLE